jgi:Transposase DDE domain
MRLHATCPLFAWSELEDTPQLRTLREVLASLPDQPLLDGLEQARHNGRNDYPVAVLWGVLLVSILCRHLHIEDCLDELARNPTLCRLLGIRSPAGIPKAWNMSRFLDTLGSEPHLSACRSLFDALVSQLGVAVPQLGQHTAGDSTALQARAKKDAVAVAQEVTQGLPQPTGGRKEYHNDDGTVSKVYEWFGYKLHLLVDVQHEVSLAYHLSDTKTPDNQMIAPLLEQASANLGDDRIHTLAYDKAADDSKVHELLHGYGIKPLIQIRKLWQDEQEQVVRVGLPIVHDEAGSVYCYDTQSATPLKRKMAYIGYEEDRGTVRYRCPARHEGFVCASEAQCNAGKKYGLSVRIDCTQDLRRFPPIPRGTREFEKRYNGRTAVERVNARLKLFWGVDDGNVTGARRFHAYVGAVMVVHAALAKWLAQQPRWEGTLGNTRLGPAAQALARLEAQPPETAAASASAPLT